jgi:hypothetical protein
MFHVKHCEVVTFVQNSHLIVSEFSRQVPLSVFTSGYGVRMDSHHPTLETRTRGSVFKLSIRSRVRLLEAPIRGPVAVMSSN